MRMAKGSRLRYAVAAVCLLAALLDGLLAGPERPQAEVPGERAALLRQRPVPGSRDSVRERDPGGFAFRRRPLQAGAGRGQAAAVAHRRSGTVTTIQLQPDQYAAHLDLANLLILGRQFNDAKDIWTCWCKSSPTIPTSTWHGQTTTPAPITPRPRWQTCRRRCNWIPPVPTLI
jgi:hypothetical protein